MKKLKPRYHDEKNGLDYVLVGDYYIPDLRLPEEDRPIGKWGQMHKEYLMEVKPILFNQLVLEGKLFTYLADLNEQANDRFRLIVQQMMKAGGVDDALKRKSQWEWIQKMNSIINRAEEIIKGEMIFV